MWRGSCRPMTDRTLPAVLDPRCCSSTSNEHIRLYRTCTIFVSIPLLDSECRGLTRLRSDFLYLFLSDDHFLSLLVLVMGLLVLHSTMRSFLFCFLRFCFLPPQLTGNSYSSFSFWCCIFLFAFFCSIFSFFLCPLSPSPLSSSSPSSFLMYPYVPYLNSSYYPSIPYTYNYSSVFLYFRKLLVLSQPQSMTLLSWPSQLKQLCHHQNKESVEGQGMLNSIYQGTISGSSPMGTVCGKAGVLTIWRIAATSCQAQKAVTAVPSEPRPPQGAPGQGDSLTLNPQGWPGWVNYTHQRSTGEPGHRVPTTIFGVQMFPPAEHVALHRKLVMFCNPVWLWTQCHHGCGALLDNLYDSAFCGWRNNQRPWLSKRQHTCWSNTTILGKRHCTPSSSRFKINMTIFHGMWTTA